MLASESGIEFAVGDLPLPTNIPPWMGAAMVLFWLALIFLAVNILRWRRALRAERRQTYDRAPRYDDDFDEPVGELSPPSAGAPEGVD